MKKSRFTDSNCRNIEESRMRITHGGFIKDTWDYRGITESHKVSALENPFGPKVLGM
jgi:hypothetical protein